MAPGRREVILSSAVMDARHLILYDGVCHLCDWFNRFTLPRDPQGLFRYASIQSETGKKMLESFGQNPEDLDTFYVIENFESDDRSLRMRSKASLFVLHQIGWPWKLACALRILPTPILDWGYDLIAKNRYRIFGRDDACIMPRPEYEDRFLDV